MLIADVGTVVTMLGIGNRGPNNEEARAILGGAVGASEIAGAYATSQGILAQGRYEKGIADLNASFERRKAIDAIDRGNLESSRQLTATQRFVGSQRAAAAVQGQDVASGSAQALQQEASDFGALDALMIRHNAILEAYGYNSQALSFESQGRFAKSAARNKARQTLIGGGLNAARGLVGTEYQFDGKLKVPEKTSTTKSGKVSGKTSTTKSGKVSGKTSTTQSGIVGNL